MASRRKKQSTPAVIEEETPVIEEITTPVELKEELKEEIASVEEVEEVKEEVKEAPVVKEKPKKSTVKPATKVVTEVVPKFRVGSIVFISKDAAADLNGFKLFPQYKKYTYTVEAYDANTGVYSLRRLNLSLKLKEAFILAPSEKSDNPLARKQF